MLVYDSQLPVLDDSFTGSEVALLAVRDGRVDRAFRRNYAWAKHAANTGKLKKFVVVVEVGGADWVHTVGAVQSALTGGLLHPAAKFEVDFKPEFESTADKVYDTIVGWETEYPAPKFVPKPQRPEPKPKAEDVKVGEKVEDSGA